MQINVYVEPDDKWLDATVMAVVRAAGATVSDEGYVSFPTVTHAEAAKKVLASMVANHLMAQDRFSSSIQL